MSQAKCDICGDWFTPTIDDHRINTTECNGCGIVLRTSLVLSSEVDRLNAIIDEMESASAPSDKTALDLGSSKPRRTYPERPKGPINTGDEPDADQVWNAAIDAARQVVVYGVLDGWIARQDDASRLIMKVIRRDVSRAIAALRKDSK